MNWHPRRKIKPITFSLFKILKGSLPSELNYIFNTKERQWFQNELHEFCINPFIYMINTIYIMARTLYNGKNFGLLYEGKLLYERNVCYISFRIIDSTISSQNLIRKKKTLFGCIIIYMLKSASFN